MSKVTWIPINGSKWNLKLNISSVKNLHLKNIFMLLLKIIVSNNKLIKKLESDISKVLTKFKFIFKVAVIIKK